MSRAKENTALQVIFSFFLGLMVLAFVGIGVNTFYPSPSTAHEEELQKLYRQQERYNMKQGGRSLTPAEQAEYDRVQAKIDALNEKQQAEQKVWARNTSIIVILLATAIMAISLIRSEQLRIVSNGLLLGGLFTMVYGVGWVLFSGESIARFFVVLFALVVTLGLGYVKFVREREDREAPAGVAGTAAPAVAGGAIEGVAFGDLEKRVERLEARTSAAAQALAAESAPQGARETGAAAPPESSAH